MRIKLNGSKMEGLYNLVNFLLLTNKPENKAEDILTLLVDKIRIRLRNRLDQFNSKDRYQITLAQEEALAFELWLNQVTLPEHDYVYEINVAQQICNQIDQQYGANFTRNHRIRELGAGSSER